MKLVFKKAKNFTGDDLAAAEKQMEAANAAYQQEQDSYNLEVSWGGSHVHYANTHTLPAVNTLKAAYDAAVQNYNNILNDINAANNAQLQAAETSFTISQLSAQQSGAPTGKDYSTYIYIGIAVLVIMFFWKS